MKFFRSIMETLEEYGQMQSAVMEGRTPVNVVGLSDIHKANWIYSASKNIGTTTLVLVGDEAAGQKLCDDINAMDGGETAVLFPSRDLVFRSVSGVSREYEHARLNALSRLTGGSARVLVASVAAAMLYTIPQSELSGHTFSIHQGDAVSLEQMVSFLASSGYVRRPQVDGISQFSVRGGILDFFPPDQPLPVRMEFWGDEIDSLCHFELESQRRMDSVDGLSVIPSREFLVGDTGEFCKKMQGFAAGVKGKLADQTRAHIAQDIEKLQNNGILENVDKYLPLICEKPATVFDYITDGCVFACELPKLRDGAKAFLWQQEEDVKALLEEGLLCKGLDRYYEDFERVRRELGEANSVYLHTFAHSLPDYPLKTLVNVNAFASSGWGGEFPLLLEDVQAALAKKYCCVVMAGTDRAAAALTEDLRKAGIDAARSEDPRQIVLGRVFVAEGSLSAGFEYPSIKLTVITHVKNGLKRKTRSRAKKASERISSLDDLAVGDFVVHVTHGIGVFEGIEKIDLHGVVKDYIKIKYAGADVLYVPVTQLDLVSKYIGPREDSSVKLNRLHSTEWQKTKQKVRKAVDEMADELIALYAARLNAKGHAFGEDNEFQRDFEQRFEYDETEDQLRCVEEIKGDMQSGMPMDRLLCGDVGFGKTEVAFRAAFKCMVEGKQCALLVPTTILAWQHYQTALKRMQGFDFRIELLSRFRTPKEQEKIIHKLKTGEIDFVIGTHRLVQKDISFHDLGLAIIDEEQRFGVAHKERFKEAFHNIDVLTLSATPIPRTLNMAMSGIRDMSVIEEAPHDRHPVQTYVFEQDMGIITDAIKKELRRGGQVFYLHNRVESIEKCGADLQKRLPDARIAVAHGKMGEDELSDVWQGLVEQEIDILVCTTIIETGVDVPNANTMIVEDADRLGLSQLYQLRGRIGRSSRRAFAYLTFRPGKVLTEIASKRLEAVREFTSFGSGFKIAMRDLEIRGAGNILGSRQHGHMASVGYDMYVRLLSEAINDRQGNTEAEKFTECLIDIRMQAHIPEDYIEDLPQRLDMYKRIASIKSQSDAYDAIDELIDRFGEPPESVKGLVDVALLRNTASRLGIYEISQKNGSLLLYSDSLDMKRASLFASALKGRVMVNAGAKPYLAVKMAKGETEVDTLRFALTKMQQALA